MKKILLVLLSFAFSVHSFSQNKNFSLEVNYPFELSNTVEKTIGIVDGSFKYKILRTELLNYGAGYNFTFIKKEFPSDGNDFTRNHFFHHLNFFAELNIAAAPKLHPYAGLGVSYSVYQFEHYYYSPGEPPIIEDKKEKDLGYNFKIGLQYDLGKHFFLQTNFHYIRTYNKFPGSDENYAINYNQIKLGGGLRF